MLQEGQEQPQACGVELVDSEIMVCLEIGDLVDAGKEIEKLAAQQVCPCIHLLSQRPFLPCIKLKLP